MKDDKTKVRKGGRPPLGELDKRGAFLSVRVRPEELAEIQQRAAESNLPLSDFVREQAIKGSILVRQFQTLSAIDRHDLARIGSNLNQIARVCNATGDSARARNIESFLAQLREVLDRLPLAGSSPHELGQG